MSRIFEPLKVGDLQLPNRIVMAPLTRLRAIHERTPNALMADYYVQRATAGLILSEATSVIPQGVGYPNSPGLWSEAQVAGWKSITDAVHQAGGRIFSQLWHVGRISHSSYLNGDLPVAPSALAPEGHVATIRPITPYEVPRALRLDEIPGIIEGYRVGAAHARAAGFDGVELHGANGYLIDQFLEDSTNRRTDAYGGPLENRARLLLEVVDELVKIWGAGRVGVHLSPRGGSHTISDSDPARTFGFVAEELGKRGLAFIFVREAAREDRLLPVLKKAFGGVIIANEGLDRAGAEQLLESGQADAVSFGRLYIANPDLVRRLAEGLPLNAVNAATIYGGGAEGYTDYPFAS